MKPFPSKNYLIFKGFNTQNYFLIEELPIPSSANEKKELIEIQGRHGYLVESEEAYEPITYDVELKLYDKNDIQRVKNAFRGSGDLILSNDLTKYYKATVTSKIDFSRVIQHYYSALVTFTLQPHAYEISDSVINLTPTFDDNGANTTIYTLTNNTNATCQPLITIYGTGATNLIIGDETIRIKDVNNHIILDFDLKEAYRVINGSNSSANKDVDADFDEIRTGATNITWNGGGVTQIKIDPRFRWL